MSGPTLTLRCRVKSELTALQGTGPVWEQRAEALTDANAERKEAIAPAVAPNATGDQKLAAVTVSGQILATKVVPAVGAYAALPMCEAGVKTTRWQPK